ncbi:MAG: 50S ribosomal protein L21e [Candidatus Diapherotrites archaeon CG08_land_8_20_14_0_20_30_16]|nr:MAG: 50S ribosomal protein L21e [Candidatus Diapherotrites archaeon CG08_land_8_20_14_0_20_30_16]
MTNKKPVGKRANTRYLFRGTKLSVETLLKNYDVGDKVVIKPNGRYHNALPFRRFAGKVGKIVEKRGRSYVVHLAKEKKDVIVGPAHIKSIH